MLTTFLLLLLGNFLLFNNYRKEYASLESLVNQNQGQLATISSLQAELAVKRKFVAQMGLLDPSRASFYSDQIALSVPSAIQLTDLSVYPVEQKLEKGKKSVEFLSNQIRIMGVAKRSNVVNNWIKELKQNAWVKDIQVVNYTQKNARVNGEFELMIELVKGAV